MLSARDELAEELAAARFATLVSPGDVKATATSLEVLIAEPSARRAHRTAGKRIAPAYRWPNVVEPLAGELAQLAGQPAGGVRRALPALRPVLAFYLNRALDIACHSTWRRPKASAISCRPRSTAMPREVSR